MEKDDVRVVTQGIDTLIRIYGRDAMIQSYKAIIVVLAKEFSEKPGGDEWRRLEKSMYALQHAVYNSDATVDKVF